MSLSSPELEIDWSPPSESELDLEELLPRRSPARNVEVKTPSPRKMAEEEEAMHSSPISSAFKPSSPIAFQNVEQLSPIPTTINNLEKLLPSPPATTISTSATRNGEVKPPSEDLYEAGEETPTVYKLPARTPRMSPRSWESCMWKQYLEKTENCLWVAPIHLFKHAPFSRDWNAFANDKVGIWIELTNGDPKSDSLWIGQIKAFAGYKALVHYLPLHGQEPDDQQPVLSCWINFCTSYPKYLNYSICEGNEIPTPPAALLSPADPNYRVTVHTTLKNLVFSPSGPPDTLPVDHDEQVVGELTRCSSRFQVGEIVEAMDKTDCGVYRLAVVKAIIGDRMLIHYKYEVQKQLQYTADMGFWFSQNSTHVHKVGWCHTVGVLLKDKPPLLSFPKLPGEEVICSDNSYYESRDIRMKAGMVFEMRHPVLTHIICCGHVVQVLKYGFLLCATDWTRPEIAAQIVLHVTSDYILPVGFAKKHKISFLNPIPAPKKGKKKKTEQKNGPSAEFTWARYLEEENLQALDKSRITPDLPPNPFTKGCKLEAILIPCPSLIRPATVVKVAGRLLQIHFDGSPRHDPSAYQWMSCDSCNIYPLGYAEIVGHDTCGKPEDPREVDHRA